MKKEAFQREAFLSNLKKILVDPISNSPLIFDDQKILGSSNYVLKNNIPVLIPEEAQRESFFTPQVNRLWAELQDLEYKMYLESPIGVFSHENHGSANKVCKKIASQASGTLLDIGCGVLERPSYIPRKRRITPFGIDPYFGDRSREFPFVQALGEFLPFRSDSFDNVVIATSLDHVYFPKMVLDNSFRVLNNSGKLFIWQTLYDENYVGYVKWKSLKGSDVNKTAQFDQFHQWAFTHESLTLLAEDSGFRLASYDILQTNNMPDGTKAVEIFASFEKDIS